MQQKIKPSRARIGNSRRVKIQSASAPNHWKAGRNRKEKSELVKDSLLWAAAQIVGEVGYAAASISRITELAGVAQGTFYNYFESRQDILDSLLPDLGMKMLDHIRKKSLGGNNFAELEERSFLAFFEFIDTEPYFFRILNEAESFAPRAHKKHLNAISKRYLRFLKRSHANGEFPGYSEDELEAIVYILMATRSYLAIRYVYGRVKHKHLPKNVAQTYMKFVRFGLEGHGDLSSKTTKSKVKG